MDGTTRYPGPVLGIIGGGQLGRMMCWEARRLGITTVVLDPSPHPPAFGLADHCIQGSLTDGDALRRLSDRADVLTYEIEHIDAAELQNIQASGSTILPDPAVLLNIQDKLRQKRLLSDAGLPVPRFTEFAGPRILGNSGGSPEAQSLTSAPSANSDEARAALAEFGLPCIQKTRRGGYDGRGVAKISRPDDPLLPGPSMLEELVDFQVELAVLLARSPSGRTRVYPVIEMVFDPHTQICNSVCAPARIPEDRALRAREIAVAAVESLNGVGIFAVELFLDSSGAILINEIAPRPHNSGHWTIEGAVTSQFEQHLRAVCGLPLGSTELIRPSVMVNLLGAAGAEGTPQIRGYHELLAEKNAFLHWYGKRDVRPNRKMGHFTVLDDSLESALSRAARLERTVRIEGDKS